MVSGIGQARGGSRAWHAYGTMITPRRLVLAWAVLWATVCTASAQPTLTPSATTVEPGSSVSVTVTGTPGHHYAIIGSTVGAGFSYAGTALAVGPDVVILATGILSNPTATIAFAPPFSGTTLDRYYLQAATSTSPTFTPLQASGGVILHNAEAVSRAQMGSSTNNSLVTLPAGASYILATPSFVASRDMQCMVTSMVQVQAGGPVTANLMVALFRNAASRDGVTANDGAGGQYIFSNGLTQPQPVVTRSTVMQVSAGQTVRFGVWISDLVYNNSLARVETSYLCQ